MGKMSLPVSCLISAARLIWENFQQTLQKLVSTLLITLLSLYTHIYLSMWTYMQRERSSLFTIIVFFNTMGELGSDCSSHMISICCIDLSILHLNGEKQSGECSAVDAVLRGAGFASAQASANLVYATGKHHSASAWDPPQPSA